MSEPKPFPDFARWLKDNGPQDAAAAQGVDYSHLRELYELAKKESR